MQNTCWIIVRRWSARPIFNYKPDYRHQYYVNFIIAFVILRIFSVMILPQNCDLRQATVLIDLGYNTCVEHRKIRN